MRHRVRGQGLQPLRCWLHRVSGLWTRPLRRCLMRARDVHGRRVRLRVRVRRRSVLGLRDRPPRLSALPALDHLRLEPRVRRADGRRCHSHPELFNSAHQLMQNTQAGMLIRGPGHVPAPPVPARPTTRSDPIQSVLIRACLYGRDACADFTLKSAALIETYPTEWDRRLLLPCSHYSACAGTPGTWRPWCLGWPSLATSSSIH